MAWEELFLLLPKLAALCSQADLEALCKIFAEQLLPGARVEPVRRLKQATPSNSGLGGLLLGPFERGSRRSGMSRHT